MSGSADHVLLLQQLLFDQATGATRSDKIIGFCKSLV
jgi:hypothetical protein